MTLDLVKKAEPKSHPRSAAVAEVIVHRQRCLQRLTRASRRADERQARYTYAKSADAPREWSRWVQAEIVAMKRRLHWLTADAIVCLDV